MSDTPTTVAVKSLESALAKYGLATVIALGLTSWLALSVSADLRALSADLRGVKDELTVHMIDSVFYMRQVCLNTAQNDVQRDSCHPGGGR